ncbi:MAG: ABC transporter permease [Candidatus Eisenbacteria bacterium]|nr:ABC transporter permease [Candidatus Eisenbacteria bacterium]
MSVSVGSDRLRAYPFRETGHPPSRQGDNTPRSGETCRRNRRTLRGLGHAKLRPTGSLPRRTTDRKPRHQGAAPSGGMTVGGGEPFTAVRYQIVVMLLVAAAVALGGLILVGLYDKSLIIGDEALRPELLE